MRCIYSVKTADVDLEVFEEDTVFEWSGEIRLSLDVAWKMFNEHSFQIGDFLPDHEGIAFFTRMGKPLPFTGSGPLKYKGRPVSSDWPGR